jgi:hypothetical protein
MWALGRWFAGLFILEHMNSLSDEVPTASQSLFHQPDASAIPENLSSVK